MRVVIFGASGNIGTALLASLAARADIEQVTAVARRLPDDERRDGSGLEVSWRSADIAVDKLDSLVEGADVVVNLAWLFHPSHHPDRTWHNNVQGARRLLNAVERARVPAAVWSSSIAAYSPRLDRRPVDESWPTDGASSAAYAREKGYVERLLDAFQLRNPDHRTVRLRPAFVFHRRAAPQQRRLFAGPFLPAWLLSPGRLPVVPVPAGLRVQTVHADDVGEAFAAAIESDASGAFNICADEVLAGRDIERILGARALTVPAGVVRALMKGAFSLHAVPADPKLFDALMSLPVISNAKAKATLGWSPTYSAADAVHEFLTGLQSGTGYPTPPLKPTAGGRFRTQELASRVGGRE